MVIRGWYSVRRCFFTTELNPLGKLMSLRGHTRIARDSNGAVLLLAMMFMLMLAVAATTAMQTAVFQLHMAGNDQFQEEAYQKVRDVATELSTNLENFNIDGGIGDTSCRIGVDGEACNRSVLSAPMSAVVPEGVVLDYRIVRQDPLVLKGFPVRESEDVASSAGSFNAALFEVDVNIQGSDKRLGNARLVRGVAVRLPILK
jgi:hypothetical protein